MGDLNYLNLANRVIRRISRPVLTNTTGASGQEQIALDMVNEAQQYLVSIENWYTLYTSRTFTTTASTATAAIPTDFGSCIDLVDTTNKRVLIEDNIRSIDDADWGNSTTGTPTHFAILDTTYHFYPIPAGAYAIRERYWKRAEDMTNNTDTTDLPNFCDNMVILHAWAGMCEYLNKFSQADRVRTMFNRELASAIRRNRKTLDNMNVFQPTDGRYRANIPPLLPANYPRGNR